VLAVLSLPSVLAACSGRSLANEEKEGTGGNGSVGGAAGIGAGSGRGGEAAGGSGGGGTGGSGGETIGGNAGKGNDGGVGGGSGSAMAGAGSGGESTGGSAGAAEPPESCSLPLEPGRSCSGGRYAYGFDSDWGRCRLFAYEGCDGNANNFISFETCSNVCGWADESGCPATYPVEGSPCMELGHACDYFPSCSCQPVSDDRCVPVDPECVNVSGTAPPEDPCSGEDCPARVLSIYYLTCTCENAAWSCGIGSQG